MNEYLINATARAKELKNNIKSYVKESLNQYQTFPEWISLVEALFINGIDEIYEDDFVKFEEVERLFPKGQFLLIGKREKLFLIEKNSIKGIEIHHNPTYCSFITKGKLAVFTWRSIVNDNFQIMGFDDEDSAKLYMEVNGLWQ